jgi:16S rRNA (uracil1498-N3)-methyltransferase
MAVSRRQPHGFVMAHVPRCLVDDLTPAIVALSGAAQRHLRTVLRLRAGDVLLLHDGRGGLAHAELLADGRARITGREAALPPPPPVTLAVAMPRLPRLEWLVEKAVELEVARLLLLRTRHGERDVGDARRARLQRLADEALLQCGRRHALAVGEPLGIDAALALRGDAALWLAAPPGGATAAPPEAPAAGVMIFVGPEGGFATEESAQLLAAGARPASLGRTVLRIETAAIALAVLALGRLAGR